VCRQIALAKAGLADVSKHRPDGGRMKGFSDYAKTDVVGDPGTQREFRNRARYLWSPVS